MLLLSLYLHQSSKLQFEAADRALWYRRQDHSVDSIYIIDEFMGYRGMGQCSLLPRATWTVQSLVWQQAKL